MFGWRSVYWRIPGHPNRSFDWMWSVRKLSGARTSEQHRRECDGFAGVQNGLQSVRTDRGGAQVMRWNEQNRAVDHERTQEEAFTVEQNIRWYRQRADNEQPLFPSMRCYPYDRCQVCACMKRDCCCAPVGVDTRRCLGFKRLGRHPFQTDLRYHGQGDI